MPTYVYRFTETGETVEVQQSFSDDTLTELEHPESGRVMAVKKVFQPVGVTFRGDGFYKTDSRAGSKAGSTATSSEGSSSSDGGGSSSTGSSESSSTGSSGSSDSSSTSTSSSGD